MVQQTENICMIFFQETCIYFKIQSAVNVIKVRMFTSKYYISDEL